MSKKHKSHTMFFFPWRGFSYVHRYNFAITGEYHNEIDACKANLPSMNIDIKITDRLNICLVHLFCKEHIGKTNRKTKKSLQKFHILTDSNKNMLFLIIATFGRKPRARLGYYS